MWCTSALVLLVFGMVLADPVAKCPHKEAIYFMSDSSDRTMFYQCERGVAVQKYCAKGTGTKYNSAGPSNPCVVRLGDAAGKSSTRNTVKRFYPSHSSQGSSQGSSYSRQGEEDQGNSYGNSYRPSPPKKQTSYPSSSNSYSGSSAGNSYGGSASNTYSSSNSYSSGSSNRYPSPSKGNSYSSYPSPSKGNSYPSPSRGNDYGGSSKYPTPQKYPSGGSKYKPSSGKKPQTKVLVVEALRTYHFVGGRRIPGKFTEDECLQQCVRHASSCQGVDYNSKDYSCWKHDVTTGCGTPVKKEFCVHYRLKMCPTTTTQTTPAMTTAAPPGGTVEESNPGYHILGGTKIATQDPIQCIRTCATVIGCQAADFNFRNHSCFLHFQDTACSALRKKKKVPTATLR